MTFTGGRPAAFARWMINRPSPVMSAVRRQANFLLTTENLMAHTAETIEIDGVKAKVAIGTYGHGTAGRSRTVNVYDQSETEGCYREVYRLPESTGLTGADLSTNATTLDELDSYLTSLGATKEGSRTN